ncbi:MAG: type II/IV secretion system protein [Fusobacteriaceae bacterium]|nr:type II/IV secretion system protein [Fusobacteriaceae bacterium]MBP9510091.1 type II/IV secretion system protein [Fusobacteriaceae bacterium]
MEDNLFFTFKASNLDKKTLDTVLYELSNTTFSVDENFSTHEKILDIESSLKNENSIIIKGVNALLIDAIQCRATDIHIESYEDNVRVRYRVDGRLIERQFFNKTIFTSLISRLKILTSLDISERRLPQDGRMKLTFSNRVIDLRISTIPTIYGEKIVLRILDKEYTDIKIDKIGFSLSDYNSIIKILNSSTGLILITGPTGSGKSTTLYSILNYLNTSDINISTIEDPVEYNIKGVNQIQVKPEIGLNFSNILKQLLRQDPDVIMIGEIRDKETAQLALKSALTGHLIFSTLHTNDAISSINRLKNLEIDNYLIAATLKLVISQRLVRTLCTHCKIPDINSQSKLLLLNIDPSLYGDIVFFVHKKNGCTHCNNTGYSGRVAIHEILIINSTLKKFIEEKKINSAFTQYLEKNGYLSIIQNGLNQAINSKTSLDEIIKIL